MIKIIADTNIPFVSECFNSLGHVHTLPGREITPQVITDADALLVRSITPVNEKLLKGTNIQFVGTATIGLEHIDTEYLAAKNIGFTSAPGSNANSVAEYIVTALLSVAAKNKIKLQGKSIGIVGVGNVGSRVEQKVRALHYSEKPTTKNICPSPNFSTVIL
ncbi:MAG: Rossmann-fold NAD(P)-binding domain-containing protein [Planctomycetota bacterium]|jgi:erythronate-4-phosphate dehydrogenase